MDPSKADSEHGGHNDGLELFYQLFKKMLGVKPKAVAVAVEPIQLASKPNDHIAIQSTDFPLPIDTE